MAHKGNVTYHIWGVFEVNLVTIEKEHNSHDSMRERPPIGVSLGKNNGLIPTVFK
jgi:hypothetical protein